MKSPTRITIPAALAILAFALAPAAPAQEAKLQTPSDIWKDYDPDAGDPKQNFHEKDTLPTEASFRIASGFPYSHLLGAGRDYDGE